MKPFLLLLFPFCFFLSPSCIGQDLKVDSAFAKTRCLGMAGSCCTTFDIHLSRYNKNIVIDSIYLKTRSIKLGQPKAYVVTDTTNKSYTIIAFETETEAKERTEPLRHHAGEPGEALIVYEYKGNTYTLVVRAFKNRPFEGNNLQ